jgi:hypothetical protein
MVFTVSLKRLNYKMNITNISDMLADQESTYAILRYAYDIPSALYKDTMDSLIAEELCLQYPKLIKLVSLYKKTNNIRILIDQDEVETKVLVIDEFGKASIVDKVEQEPMLQIEFDED